MRTAEFVQSCRTNASVRARIESYFRAWRLSESSIEELAAEAEHAIHCALLRGEAADPLELLAPESDRVLAARMSRDGMGEASLDSCTRLALALAGTRLGWAEADEEQFHAEVEELKRKVETLAEPNRSAELAVGVMQTSLSRLPSIRMVAGWFLLVLLLFLTFVFTR